jgi:hypothetical protein
VADDEPAGVRTLVVVVGGIGCVVVGALVVDVVVGAVPVSPAQPAMSPETASTSAAASAATYRMCGDCTQLRRAASLKTRSDISNPFPLHRACWLSSEDSRHTTPLRDCPIGNEMS